MINRKDILKRFIKYVKISSPSKREGKMLKQVKKDLLHLGIRSREDNAAGKLNGDAGNLSCFINGSIPKAPRLLINAHIDTVMPGINIRPKVRKGIVTSDGRTVLGADNKAGVAVIMEVLDEIKKKKIKHGPLDVIFTVAEEIGLCGSSVMNKGPLKADFGYVLDGGRVNEIINKAPSQDSIEVKITGKAAHAGVHPEKGINAIRVASEAVSKIRLGRIDRETTSNIGLIKGGIATNIVPETVVLKGEARSHDPKKLRRQVEHMRAAFRSACRRNGAKLDFNVRPAYRAFEISKGHRALKLALASAKKLGLKPQVKATGGGSDANIFKAFGVPCLIIGVGAHNVHTTKEQVSANDMLKGAMLLLEIIKGASA